MEMMENNQLAITASQQVARYQLHQHSINLIALAIKAEAKDEEVQRDAKAELIEVSSKLMPAGMPDFPSIIKYPMVRELIASEGKKNTRIALFFIIKAFCASLNLVRNMNEDQMIECAQMLIDECGNFRLEDYIMMFQMAKRGGLVKILDRMDVQVVSQMLDTYWDKRHQTGKRMEEADIKATDGVTADNPNDRKNLIWNGKEGYVEEESAYDKAVGLASSLETLKGAMRRNGMQNLNEEEAKKQIVINPNYNNPHQPLTKK